MKFLFRRQRTDRFIELLTKQAEFTVEGLQALQRYVKQPDDDLARQVSEVEKKADGTYGTTELFTTEEFGDQTKPPILHNGYFYAQYGTNRRRDGLVCMSMDCQIMWKTKRSPDFNKGSMILADGLILATDGKKTLFLIEPDPSGFKPLASAELLGDAGTDSEGIARTIGGATQNWAPLALSDGKLLIRDHKQMKCVVVR